MWVKTRKLLRAWARRSRDYPQGYEAVELDMLQLAHGRKLHKDECYPQVVAVYRSTSIQSHYDPTSDIYILAHAPLTWEPIVRDRCRLRLPHQVATFRGLATMDLHLAIHP